MDLENMKQVVCRGTYYATTAYMCAPLHLPCSGIIPQTSHLTECHKISTPKGLNNHLFLPLICAIASGPPYSYPCPLF